jgi:hypothetical protein
LGASPIRQAGIHSSGLKVTYLDDVVFGDREGQDFAIGIEQLGNIFADGR